MSVSMSLADETDLRRCQHCGSQGEAVERHEEILGTTCGCVLTTLQIRQSLGVSKNEVSQL